MPTVWFEVVGTWHRPVPEQAPVHPRNVDPWFGTAFSFTVVPLLKLALHIAPQSMPAGKLVTIPLPEPELFTESIKVFTLKMAATDCVESIVTWHVPVPEQAPPHPWNVEPWFGIAVSCTVVPLVKLALHVVWQFMPAGELVTMPLPEPELSTVSVNPTTLKIAVTDCAELNMT